MSQPIIEVSVATAAGAVAAGSPIPAGQVVISGSPNAGENRNYDTANYTERTQLSRVLKKRYVTAGGFHVRNVVECLAALGL
jgi:hypothetical protein